MTKLLGMVMLVGCGGAGVVEGVGSGDSGGVSNPDSGMDTGDVEPVEPFRWCIDFETGDLSEIGYSGAQVSLGNGALLANVKEAEQFSALTAEDRIEFRGDHALLMRAYPLEQPALLAVVSTPFFRVEDADLSWVQLSEVGEGGIWLAADVMDTEGYVLGSLELPVETGGHLAGLPPDYAPIEGLADVVVGEGMPGEFVGQRVDMTPFLGEEISLRVYQYSRVDDNAFFTLLDDICSGWSQSLEAIPALSFGAPEDWGF